MKVIINVLKYILITCLVMLLTLGIYINIFSSTILKKEYIISQLEENNYYGDMYKEIESNFEKYIAQSGLDESVLNNIITEDMIKSDVNTFLDCMYDGKNANINTEILRKNLTNNIDKSLENITISNATKKSITDFIDKIVNEYENTMLHSKYVKTINPIYNKIVSLIETLKNVIIFGIVIFIIVLIILNIKTKYKFILDVGIAQVSTGAFIVITNTIINLKVKIEHIKIFNDSISKALIGIIKNVMRNLNQFAIICIMIGIVLIVISAVIQEYKRKAKKSKEK